MRGGGRVAEGPSTASLRRSSQSRLAAEDQTEQAGGGACEGGSDLERMCLRVTGMSMRKTAYTEHRASGMFGASVHTRVA